MLLDGVALGADDAHTLPTPCLPWVAGWCVEVAACECVASATDPIANNLCRWGHASSKIRAARHRLKMVWIDARRDATQVVENQSFRDRPDMERVTEAVCKPMLALMHQFSVAVRPRAPGPDPTVGDVFNAF